MLCRDGIFSQINKGLGQRVLNPLTSFCYLPLGRVVPFSADSPCERRQVFQGWTMMNQLRSLGKIQSISGNCPVCSGSVWRRTSEGQATVTVDAKQTGYLWQKNLSSLPFSLFKQKDSSCGRWDRTAPI